MHKIEEKVERVLRSVCVPDMAIYCDAGAFQKARDQLVQMIASCASLPVLNSSKSSTVVSWESSKWDEIDERKNKSIAA